MIRVFNLVEEDLSYEEEYTSDAALHPVTTDYGEFTDFPVVDFNIIVSKPRIVLRKFDLSTDDTWFMEPDWLEGEKEADENIENNRYDSFENAHDAVDFLRSCR